MALGQDSARLRRSLDMARRALDGVHQLGDGFDAPRQELQQAIKSAESENLLIVVVGSAKRGKSTLINGILGRRDDTLAPVGRFPATNVVSVFRHGQSPKVEVHFEDGLGSREITEHEIREYACEDRNPGNQKKVGLIDVSGPFGGIDQRTVLADLPGADNVQGAQHTQTLFGFLPRADAIIFLTTADEPINAAEQALLRHIKGLGLKANSVIFAVNKKDYVRLGELDADELSDGIAHNRRIIESVGFPNPTIHAISARDYLEGKPESGVDGLIAAMQALVEHERIDVMVERLDARVKLIVEEVRELSHGKLALAKSTTDQLQERHAQLVESKRSLDRGRHERQAQFIKEWRSALDDLCKATGRIESELKTEYGALIDKSSSSEVKALLQTVHSDVHLAVRERVKPELDTCNGRLEKAQLDLVATAGFSPMGFGDVAASAQPAASSFKDVQDALKIAAAGLPATATSAGLLAAPGIVGAIIASAAPSVAVTLNPLTWVTGALALPGAAAVTATQTLAVGVIGTIAAPLSVVAIGYAGYRSYRAVKSLQAQDRNQLKSAVFGMVEGMCRQVADDARIKREKADDLLSEFHTRVTDQIAASERELERLIRDRPTDAQVRELERIAAGATALERGLIESGDGASRDGAQRPWLRGGGS